MANSASASTPDVVKTNRVWSPIYNTLEMFFSATVKVFYCAGQIFVYKARFRVRETHQRANFY